MTIVAECRGTHAGLRESAPTFAVTEYLLAGQIAARESWRIEWAPAELARYPVVLGLWKGDLTLKRAIVAGSMPWSATAR